MVNDDGLGDVAGYRLRELERRVDGLTEHAVSREWLEERQRRTDDAIAAMKRELLTEIRDIRGDVAEIKQTERTRRNAVYAALLTGVVSVVAALVIAALTLPGGSA